MRARKGEVAAAALSCAVRPAQAQLARCFGEADADGDGLISRAEFIDLVKKELPFWPRGKVGRIPLPFPSARAPLPFPGPPRAAWSPQRRAATAVRSAQPRAAGCAHRIVLIVNIKQCGHDLNNLYD